METWRLAAATNNAEWCDAVCRSHHLESVLDDVAWTCSANPPPDFPNAVTLVPHLSIAGVLSRIQPATDCAIKDSFASLDLRDRGFRVLFDAQWIARPAAASSPSAPSRPPWNVVRDPDGLRAWGRAWRRRAGPEDLFRPELLDDPAVTFVAARTNGHVTAGAVLSRSSTVLGISNLFINAGDLSTGWAGCIAACETLYPGASLVGYESGPMLAAAEAQGFEAVGPLRVWFR